ncbi:DUF551 domain-containing protein [Avibacterium paragallinarum]|uniref:DUF551 domain-containing protein n=1 Tax=Avibacterium paragallinarum TaxID=728 RepID=UPI00397830BF
MKPFDLKKALEGEPVLLLNGSKAYVLHQFKHNPKHLKSLLGYKIHKTPEGKLIESSLEWFADGSTEMPSSNSIIGMWEEPKPKRFINGIEVQQPLTMKTYISGEKYWCVDLESSELVTEITLYAFNTESLNLVTRGLAFRRKQDAKAMAKALLNYNVEYKNDDNAYANNGWIDINKQLPPLGTKVIGRCVIDGKVLILIIVKKLVGSEYWFSPVNIYGTFDDKAVDVTHWQPLPKLPQA